VDVRARTGVWRQRVMARVACRIAQNVPLVGYGLAIGAEVVLDVGEVVLPKDVGQLSGAVDRERRRLGLVKPRGKRRLELVGRMAQGEVGPGPSRIGRCLSRGLSYPGA